MKLCRRIAAAGALAMFLMLPTAVEYATMVGGVHHVATDGTVISENGAATVDTGGTIIVEN